MSETTGVVLRAFQMSDVDDLVAGCNDPLTQQFLPALPGPYTTDDARWWITEGAPGQVAAGGLASAFADPGTDRLLGGGGVRPLGYGVGEIGYWVAPWARGRGVASAAARLMTAEAFDGGLERLVLRARPENPHSQRVALAAGYTRESVERGGGRGRDGDRHDMVVWARLATDPVGPTKRALPDLPGGQLTDGVVTLRPLTEADAVDTHALRSLPEVVNTSVPPQAPELDRVRGLCQRAQSEWLSGRRADLTIRDAATGGYAGEIGLYYWEQPTLQAMIGYSLMPEYRGRGFTTRAVRLVTGWGFDQVGLIRVIAGTAPDNLASQAVLQRAGFEKEGYMRDRLPGPDGTRIDDVQWALLRGR
jgi:RimJ/RimL family protein N-acetyltransferase